MNGWGYKDTLSQSSWQLKQCGSHIIANLFIHQTIFPSSGNNAYFLLTYHIVEGVCIHPCSIYHDHGFYGFCCSPGIVPVFTLLIRNHMITDCKHIAFLQLLNAGYFLMKSELCTIHCSVFCKGVGHIERTDNASGRGVQCRHHRITDMRLHLSDLFSGQDLQSFYTIFLSLVIQFIQCPPGCFVHAKHQRAILFVWKIQFFCQFRHHLTTAYIHQCLHRPRFCIMSGVHNTAVGLGGPFTHVAGFLQHQHRTLTVHQFSCNGTTGYPCTNHNHIIHF